MVNHTFAGFVEHATKRYYQLRQLDDSWRFGQVLFNELLSTRPDIAEKIRATEMDPFYNNGKMDMFLNFVADRW